MYHPRSMMVLYFWAGLMTMPLIVYFLIMLTPLTNPGILVHGVPDAPYVFMARDVLLLGGLIMLNRFLFP